MGGILIIISVVVPTLLWANLRNPYVWIALFGMASFGLIGFWDDYAKIRHKQNKGLTVREKFGLQVVAALIVGFILLSLHANRLYSTSINVPFFKSFKPDLLIEALAHNWYTYPLAFAGFYAFMVLVIVGASDAVNLTDGLDGLAIGLMIIASGAMTILTYVSGNAKLAEYLRSGPAARRRGTDHFLRIDGGRIHWISLVQRASGGNFHGRRRIAGSRRSSGSGRGLNQAGDPAVVHRRRLCDRSAVGNPSSGQLQASQEADLQDGANSPSFRGVGLAGVEDYHAILDSRFSNGIVRLNNAEA